MYLLLEIAGYFLGGQQTMWRQNYGTTGYLWPLQDVVQLSLCQWNELTPCRAQSKQYASLALGLQFPSGSPRNKGKYSLIAHPIAQVGLNKVLCTTATGIPSSFRAWILVHRLHVQECVSVHGFLGLLLTTTHFPKGASHGSCRASTQILQPQELWAEHSQKQFECGEVFVISLLNVRASFFLQSFCSPTLMVQIVCFLIPCIFLIDFQPSLTQSSSIFSFHLPITISLSSIIPMASGPDFCPPFSSLSFSLFFPLHSGQVPFLKATWIPGTSASSVGERVSCSCMHHWLCLPCGFSNGNDNDST